MSNFSSNQCGQQCYQPILKKSVYEVQNKPLVLQNYIKSFKAVTKQWRRRKRLCKRKRTREEKVATIIF